MWVVFGGFAVASSLIDYRLLLSLGDPEGFANLANVDASNNRQVRLAGIQIAGYIAVGVLFIAWTRRVYRNAATLGPPPEIKLGWAVWGWAVPVLNLWRPKQVIDHAWRASNSPPSDRVAPLVHWWWGLWIVSTYIGRAIPDEADTLAALRSQALWVLVLDVVLVASAIVTFLVVAQLTARQEDHAELAFTGPGQPINPMLPPTVDHRSTATPMLGRILGLSGLSLLAGVLAFSVWNPSGTPPSEETGLVVGACLPNGLADVHSPLAQPVTVDCSEPHIGEIYGIIEYPEPRGPYPGDRAVKSRSDAACLAVQAEYLQGPPTLVGEPFLEVGPSESTWEFGDRDILCLFISDEPRTGSLRGVGADLSAISMFDMEPGTCFADDSFLFSYHAVPRETCDEYHLYEVLTREEIYGIEFPGMPEISATAERVCMDFLDSAGVQPYGVHWLHPSEETWDLGDRAIYCVAELLAARQGSLIDS